MASRETKNDTSADRQGLRWVLFALIAALVKSGANATLFLPVEEYLTQTVGYADHRLGAAWIEWVSGIATIGCEVFLLISLLYWRRRTNSSMVSIVLIPACVSIFVLIIASFASIYLLCEPDVFGGGYQMFSSAIALLVTPVAQVSVLLSLGQGRGLAEGRVWNGVTIFGLVIIALQWLRWFFLLVPNDLVHGYFSLFLGAAGPLFQILIDAVLCGITYELLCQIRDSNASSSDLGKQRIAKARSQIPLLTIALSVKLVLALTTITFFFLEEKSLVGELWINARTIAGSMSFALFVLVGRYLFTVRSLGTDWRGYLAVILIAAGAVVCIHPGLLLRTSYVVDAVLVAAAGFIMVRIVRYGHHTCGQSSNSVSKTKR